MPRELHRTAVPYTALLLAILGCSENRSPDWLAEIEAYQLARRGKITFVTDSATGYELARRSSRPCLLFFTAEWCTFCHQMEETAFADVSVAQLAENFVCILVDAERESRVCRHFKVTGFPTVQFVSAEGRPLHRLVGRQSAMRLASGMRAALKRYAWLDGAKTKLR